MSSIANDISVQNMPHSPFRFYRFEIYSFSKSRSVPFCQQNPVNLIISSPEFADKNCLTNDVGVCIMSSEILRMSWGVLAILCHN